MTEQMIHFPTRAELMRLVRRFPEWDAVTLARLAVDRYSDDDMSEAMWARLVIACDDLLREFHS